MTDDPRDELAEARAMVVATTAHMDQLGATLRDGLVRQHGGSVDQAAEAVRRLAERIDVHDPIDRSVMDAETRYLAEEGPACYLRYVARLDDARVRADLDRYLDGLDGGAL
ncbi:hypothetical protein [Actinomadura fibrosa]|uniref:Uncharacterized protein n=1 Tax=Actinomadura fibrosa TaxID=111802 RepID=A0ABW2XKP6_9ACTN|nr:hypothetical protein [Actinomadura fibrosa]